jgi:glycosyltransferase involved in cell wall biosynthesis
LVTAQGASATSADRNEIVVVSMTQVGPIGQELRSQGVRVVAVGMSGPLGAWHAFVALRSLMREIVPDVVQTWMVHANLLGGLAARSVGIRSVIWGIRSTGVDGASRSTRLVRRVGAWFSSSLPHTIVCAARASLRSHAAIGYDERRMVVIPNGFDLEKFRPQPSAGQALRTELGLLPDHIVIGHVGRWNAAKDHLCFIKAAIAVAEADERCRFVLVGRDVDDGNAELAAALAPCGVKERFMLLGERRDVPACLAAMDLFCLSSRAEGFPNVVGEAMSMQLPCVVTDVGDAGLLVGDTGWIVPKESPVELAAALIEAASEPSDLRRQRGRCARRRIEHEFSLAQAIDRFTELQRRVLAETRKGVA